MSAEGAGGFLGMKGSGPEIGMSLVRRQPALPPTCLPMFFIFSEIPPICVAHYLLHSLSSFSLVVFKIVLKSDLFFPDEETEAHGEGLVQDGVANHSVSRTLGS